jgi:transcriptional regulator with XRE-family HTH domain
METISVLTQNQIIASNLKKARTALGWSQEKAAQLFRIKRSTLASYEEGRALPSLTFYPKLVTVYSIHDWLGFITNKDFDYADQVTNSQPLSLIEQNFNLLSEKEKNLARTLLNLP